MLFFTTEFVVSYVYLTIEVFIIDNAEVIIDHGQMESDDALAD